MDNKKLNEQESLELITQMIQNTKFKMVKNAGTPFLVWGYMTVVTSLLVWYLLKETLAIITGSFYGSDAWLFLTRLLSTARGKSKGWQERILTG